MKLEDALESAFARAYKDAEERKAEEEAARQAKVEADALSDAAAHVYDPRPYPEAMPHDPTLYAGTGIGALYGLPDSEHFLAELGDWTLGKETT